ncbi:MAG: hypothetical protein R8K47_05050 [Mariprofundaceae bacterium]
MLVAAVRRIVATERLIKGASDFDDGLLVERLCLDLIDEARLRCWMEGRS